MSKIFGVGLSKTGTNSLTLALQHLGYSAIHYPANMQLIESHDAATDTPVAAAYKSLDAQFPGSRFIFTERDQYDWLESNQRHFLKRQDNMSAFAEKVQMHLFGTLTYNRDLYIKAYANHREDVQSYFANRPDDLLWINICDDAPSWEPLCRFLGKPVPEIEFPFSNRTSVTDQLLARLLQFLGDVNATAQVSGVNAEYLKGLPTVSADDPPLQLDGGRFNAKIITHLVNEFGDIETTASTLNIAADSIAKAVAWTRDDYGRRAASDQPPKP